MKMKVLAPPICRYPVGEGAKRRTGFLLSVMRGALLRRGRRLRLLVSF